MSLHLSIPATPTPAKWIAWAEGKIMTAVHIESDSALAFTGQRWADIPRAQVRALVNHWLPIWADLKRAKK